MANKYRLASFDRLRNGREVMLFSYVAAGVPVPKVLPARQPILDFSGRHVGYAVNLRIEDGNLYGVIRLNPLPPIDIGDDTPRTLH